MPKETSILARIVSKQRMFEGFCTVDVVRFEARSLKDGGYAKEAERDVFTIGDIAILLPYDPQADTVLLSRQFRLVPFLMEEADPFLLECPGGFIDEGETPEQAARREAREETGCDVQDIEYIGHIYPSPGGVCEKHHLFVARIGRTEPGYFGMQDEGEEIETHIISADEAIAMLDAGKFRNASTNVLMHWFVRNRDRLREQWS